jgi:hypothetical protein
MADAAPISLYFEVAEGQSPDLEVIANASIAWSRLVKEIGSVVDPSLELRVEFLSGTIGSRSINSIVRAVQKVAIENPWTVGPLLTIAGVFLIAPVNHVADHAWEEVYRWFGHADQVSLDDASIDRVAARVGQMERNQRAVELRNEVFRQSQLDPIIEGLGTTPLAERKPAIIVPRSEFSVRSGVDKTVIESVERRVDWKYDYPVVIIRSYSKGEERRWRFEHGGREFSATMKDPNFLAAIKSGHTGVEIGEGVEMRIDLRIKMERIGGVWHEKESDVMRVVYPVIGKQMLLQLSPDQPNEPQR